MNHSRSAEAPSNSFEAWKYLFEDTTLQDVALKGLAFILLGFWNMDGKGRCNPSQATLMARTGIKSPDTLRTRIYQLVLSGHFAIVQRPGRSTQFYPMFVKNARTDLLAQSQQEVRDRLAGKKSAVAKVEVEQSHTTEDATSNVAPTPEAAPEGIPAHRFGSWVKTEKDLAIVELYDEEASYIAEHPEETEPSGFPVLFVVADVAATGLTDMDTTPKCVIAGTKQCATNVLPGRWVEQWGRNYGTKFTISQIASVYDELLTVGKGEVLPYSMVHEVDVAMHVLGRDGFVPSKAVINALRYAPNLDDHMSKLRVSYQETLRARELCLEHILRGNYDTTNDNR